MPKRLKGPTGRPIELHHVRSSSNEFPVEDQLLITFARMIVVTSNADENQFDESVRWLIECGFELTGGAAGGVIGFCAGGPIGAAVFGAGGVAIGKALNSIGKEFSERLLGPREKMRIGGVIACAASKIKERLERGEKMRDDGFFDKDETGRSEADEILENVLLKCQREPQEKKIPYMAHLLSSLAFEPKIGVHLAHQIIKAAEQLSYRQLCLLKLAVCKDTHFLRKTDYRGFPSIHWELLQILYESYDLYQKGLIHFDTVLLGLADVIPDRMTLQGIGAHLYNLMYLHLIPDDDLTPIVDQFKSS